MVKNLNDQPIIPDNVPALRTVTHQVIFQVYTSGKWLDYCREASPSAHQSLSNRWGKEQCEMLQARERSPFRFIVEHWD